MGKLSRLLQCLACAVNNNFISLNNCLIVLKMINLLQRIFLGCFWQLRLYHFILLRWLNVNQNIRKVLGKSCRFDQFLLGFMKICFLTKISLLQLSFLLLMLRLSSFSKFILALSFFRKFSMMFHFKKDCFKVKKSHSDKCKPERP